MANASPRQLIAFQAVRFREELKTLKEEWADRPSVDDLQDLANGTRKLEVLVCFLICKVLGNDEFKKLDQLAALGKAKPAERKKQFEALGASEAGFSRDDFDRMCKAAAEVL